jgi:hypothetical protein
VTNCVDVRGNSTLLSEISDRLVLASGSGERAPEWPDTETDEAGNARLRAAPIPPPTATKKNKEKEEDNKNNGRKRKDKKKH